jgi:hypothetical protein
MGKVAASVGIDASLAEAWEHYFDPRGWPAWVDGFGAVGSADGYPERGGTLTWRSRPAGRGEVTERVLDHEPRRLHRIAFSDPESEGTLTVRFEIGTGEGTRVTQELEYRLRGGGPIAPLTDALFVRSQMRRSLERSLTRFKLEAEERAHFQA